MAAPITHIVLTKKIFPKYFGDKNKKEFYIGTSFPDIRYLGVIDREKTHFKDLKLEDIVKEESFIAGLQFHSYLDEVREDFVVSKNIYQIVPESKYITQAIKFLEDEVLYEKGNNWEQFINYFDDILPQELEFGIEEMDLRRWHHTLQRTFSRKPDSKDLEEFVANIGRPKQMADEINTLMPQLRENIEVLGVINSMYDNFEKLLNCLI